MTEIRIIYDPFKDNTTLIYDGRRVRSIENKIYSYILSEGFHKVLMPFRKRYSVWNGLLPEIMNEVNDNELNITFEGKAENFEELKKAFEDCRDIVENSGYTNDWTLVHAQNYENENIIAQLITAAEKLKPLCETRAELREADKFRGYAENSSIAEAYDKLMSMINGHIEKWEACEDKYKDNKISELEMIRELVLKTSGLSESLKEVSDNE